MAATDSIPRTEERARPRRRSIVGPLILIGLGVLFLGQNLGLLTSDVWATLWRFWPVLLILAGLEIVLGRGSWLGGLIGAFVLVLILGTVTWVATVGELPVFHLGNGITWGDRGNWADVSGPAGVERIAEDLGDASRATYDLNYGAGRLVISALPADSTQLIQGDLEYPDNSRIDRNVVREGGVAQVTLTARYGRDVNVRRQTRGTWTVGLSPKVPSELKVSTGASELDLDLSNLLITRLDVQAGASGVKVILPQAAGLTTATIKSGVSGVEVTVPEGVAARIHAQTGLSGVSIAESRFPKVSGNLYQSPNYDTARNRVDLTVETGISGVTIR